MKPHYADDRTTIYHGDCREVLSRLPRLLQADFVWLVMDPPYGIDYQSGSRRDTLAASIQGDKDTSLRDEILARLRAKVAAGRPIVGGGAGTGISAKMSEAGGIDLLVIYNSGRFRMGGRGSLSGMMPYGDANAIVMDMARDW